MFQINAKCKKKKLFQPHQTQVNLIKFNIKL